MSISSGAAAGGGSDAIEEILKQAFAQQIANRRAAQDDSRIKIEQQRADDERAYRMEAMRAANETRASALQMQKVKQADDLTTKLGEHSIGQELSTPNVSTLKEVYPDTVKDPTLGSRNLSGMLRMVSGSEGPPALDLTSTPNPGKRETYLGTGPQQEQKQASDAYDQQVAATTDPIMRGKLQMLKSLVPDAGKRGAAAVELLKEQKATPDKFMTVGQGGTVLDATTGKPIFSSPKPPAADHFSLVPGVGADGKPAMFRVNAQTGEAVIVNPTGGGNLGKAPTVDATTANRLQSAKAVVQTGNDIIKELSDPKVAANLGPAMSRYNSVADFVGNPPPEFSHLAGLIESFSLANMGVHGMRSNSGAEAIKQTLGLNRHTPGSVTSVIQGINGFANHLLENNGQSAEGNPSTGKPSAADLIKKYGGG